MAPILGCDISKWQGQAGMSQALFNDLHAQGVRFMAARASIGGLIDPSFGANRARAKAKGWEVLGYHFLYPGNVTTQARLFVAQLATTGGTQGCGMVVDVEWIKGGHGPRYADVAGFEAAIRQLVPGHPQIIYTASGYWRSSAIGNRGLPADLLWDARWTGVNKDNLPAQPPTGGYGGSGRTRLWQFGALHSLGHVIDGDAWYGTLAQLRELTGRPITPPPPPPPPQPKEGDVNVADWTHVKATATTKPKADIVDAKGAHITAALGTTTFPWLAIAPDGRYVIGIDTGVGAPAGKLIHREGYVAAGDVVSTTDSDGGDAAATLAKIKELVNA